MSVEVEVRNGWLVYDGQQQRSAGETVEVEPNLAQQWVAAGWAEPVKTPPARKRTAAK